MLTLKVHNNNNNNNVTLSNKNSKISQNMFLKRAKIYIFFNYYFFNYFYNIN